MALRASRREGGAGGAPLTLREEQCNHGEPATLLGRRTAPNDAAACQDEPIAAPFLNS